MLLFYNITVYVSLLSLSHLSNPIAFFSVIICPTSAQSAPGSFFQACAALLACSFEAWIYDTT